MEIQAWNDGPKSGAMFRAYEGCTCETGGPANGGFLGFIIEIVLGAVDIDSFNNTQSPPQQT